MSSSANSGKGSIKRSSSIAEGKKPAREPSPSHKASNDPQTDEKPVQPLAWDFVDFNKLQGMDPLDKDLRYEIYNRRRQELNQDLQGCGYDGWNGSVNSALYSAFSVNQWRSTPSPKPIRTNWSNLPGASDWYKAPAPVFDEPKEPKTKLGRKLSQWHGSVKRALRVSRIPRLRAPWPTTLPTILYKPLAIQTAENSKLRVKNWTREDREHNRWLNDGPPLPPFPEPVPSSSAAPAPNRSASEKKKFRSSLPLAIKRKPVPSRAPVPNAEQEAPEQRSHELQNLETKVPSPNPFEAAFALFMQDREKFLTESTLTESTPAERTPVGSTPVGSTPAESTRASRRMGMLFPEGVDLSAFSTEIPPPEAGVDLRDIPTEISAPSIAGEGSRYPTQLPEPVSASNSEPSSSTLGLIFATCPLCDRSFETEPVPNAQETAIAQPNSYFASPHLGMSAILPAPPTAAPTSTVQATQQDLLDLERTRLGAATRRGYRPQHGVRTQPGPNLQQRATRTRRDSRPQRGMRMPDGGIPARTARPMNRDERAFEELFRLES